MAFERDDFQRVGAGLSGIAPSVFTYSSVADNIAAQRAANYFNDAAAELTKGDFIIHNQLTAGAIPTAQATVSVVTNITAANVVSVAAIS